MSNKMDAAKLDYIKGMKYKDIAKKYDVKMNTVKSWRSRYWKDVKRDATQKPKKVAHKKEKVAHTGRNDVAAADEVMNSELTDKQQLFCMLYLRYYNATKSYKLAYGCDYESAKANGPRLMADDRVQSLLKKLKDKQSNDLFLNANDILKQYAKQVFGADIGDFVRFGHKTDEDEDGQKFQRSYLYFRNQDDVDTSMIDSIHIGQNGAEVKLPDKQKAMKELLQRLPEPTNTNKQDNSFVKALQNSLYGKGKNKDDDSNENEEN